MFYLMEMLLNTILKYFCIFYKTTLIENWQTYKKQNVFIKFNTNKI